MTNSEIAVTGHNNPPSDTEWLGENLTLKNVHVMRAVDGHIEISANMPDYFTDEDEAEYTTGFIKLMQNCIKEIERRRKAEKEPFLRQGQYVDIFFGEMTERLDKAINRANGLLKDWLTRKAESVRAEREAEAMQLAQDRDVALKEVMQTQGNTEERAAAVDHALTMVAVSKIADSVAAAPLASLGKTTVVGASAGLQSKWVGTVSSIDELDLFKLRPYISPKELQAALDRFVKQGGRQCEGAKIREIMEAKVK